MSKNGYAPPGQFSYQNIMLPDGTQTLPGEPLVASTGLCRLALADLAAMFPGDPAVITVADLGCLEGGFAAEFARAGYDVTGIEGRAENYDCAMSVRAALGLANLDFMLGDVREVLPGLSFDAVFCSGLLYHLDRPVAFLNLLGQVTRRLLLLNTHVSMEGGHPEGSHFPGEWCGPPELGPEGYWGHWYHEDTANRWASIGNTDSFWLAPDELTRALHDAGFGVVETQRDWLTDLRTGAPSTDIAVTGASPTPDRVMIAALKPRGGTA